MFVFGDFMKPNQRIEHVTIGTNKEYFIPDVRIDEMPVQRVTEWIVMRADLAQCSGSAQPAKKKEQQRATAFSFGRAVRVNTRFARASWASTPGEEAEHPCGRGNSAISDA